MIKCISFDMDGTLLNSKKELPKDFLEVASLLHKKGIKLVIASGRQYAALKRTLGDCYNLFTFLSDNGTLVYENDECVFSDMISDENVNAVLKIVEQLPYGACISTIHGAYVSRKTYDVYFDSYKQYYSNQIVVDDYSSVKDVVKFAIYDPTYKFEFINQFDVLNNYLNVFNSGPDWYDIQNYGVSKGACLEKWSLMQGFNSDEVLAFGDAMNDYEMIKFAGHGVAMANADDRVKAVAKHITASNDEDGVMIILRQLLKNDCKM